MISSKRAVSVALLLPLLQIDVMTDDGGHQERQKEEVRKPLGTGISLCCRHFWIWKMKKTGWVSEKTASSVNNGETLRDKTQTREREDKSLTNLWQPKTNVELFLCLPTHFPIAWPHLSPSLFYRFLEAGSQWATLTELLQSSKWPG